MIASKIPIDIQYQLLLIFIQLLLHLFCFGAFAGIIFLNWHACFLVVVIKEQVQLHRGACGSPRRRAHEKAESADKLAPAIRTGVPAAPEHQCSLTKNVSKTSWAVWPSTIYNIYKIYKDYFYVQIRFWDFFFRISKYISLF